MKVWTFQISSGPPFKLSVPNNPPLDYQGGREIWKLTATRISAEAILRMMESLAVSVSMTSEEQSPEQAAERRRLLGLE